MRPSTRFLSPLLRPASTSTLPLSRPSFFSPLSSTTSSPSSLALAHRRPTAAPVAMASRTLATSASTPPFPTAAAAGPGGAPSWAEPLADATPEQLGLHRYIVLALDHTDAASQQRRYAVREQHLLGARDGKKVGRITLGGALLSSDPATATADNEPKRIGSLIIAYGKDIDDVRARVAQDPYVTGNVWDPSTLQILPFLEASLGPDSSATAPTPSASASADKVTLAQLRATPGHTLT